MQRSQSSWRMMAASPHLGHWARAAGMAAAPPARCALSSAQARARAAMSSRRVMKPISIKWCSITLPMAASSDGT